MGDGEVGCAMPRVKPIDTVSNGLLIAPTWLRDVAIAGMQTPVYKQNKKMCPAHLEGEFRYTHFEEFYFFFFRVLHSLSTTVVVFSHHSLSRFLFHMLCLTFLPSFLRNSCYFSRFPHSSFPSSLNKSNSTSLRLFPSFIYSQTLVSQEGVPDHLGNVS